MKRITRQLLSTLTAALILLGSSVIPLTAYAEAPVKTAVAQSQTVNINTANAEELATLRGIGPIKAAAIIRFREEHGPFASIDEMMAIKGIGEKTVEKNRLLVSVE